MSARYPVSWSNLRYPWQRAELLEYLHDLSATDPRPAWKTAAAQGHISRIDQVIHFFLDDHEFDEREIRYTLLDRSEVASIHKVKAALDALVDVLPDGGDDDYVVHALWPAVANAASAAHRELVNR